MQYEYVNVANETDVIERSGSMHNPPNIGSTVTVKGKKYRRVPSAPRMQPVWSRHIMSKALPIDWPYAPDHIKSGPDKGRPCFTSQKQVDESVARANAHGEGVIYNGDAGVDTRED